MCKQITEIWCVINGWGFYQVSNMGNVRRTHTVNNKPYDLPKVLKSFTHKGYCFVKLSMEKRQKNIAIHALVLENFKEIKPNSNLVCRHLDGDKKNNNITNLCWGTPKENYEDSIKHGTSKLHNYYGNLNKATIKKPRKLTNEIVTAIRNEYIPYKISKPILAKKYGICIATVQKILERKIWSDI